MLFITCWCKSKSKRETQSSCFKVTATVLNVDDVYAKGFQGARCKVHNSENDLPKLDSTIESCRDICVIISGPAPGTSSSREIRHSGASF